MRALQFTEYGSPDVLTVAEAPEPHAGPGQVRIRVSAASVNPMDWKIRAGYLAKMSPSTFPVIPGSDAAGVVDEVGEGVQGVAVGDDVFGSGHAVTAEYAVLDHFETKPESLSFVEAAGLPMAVETAARALADVPFSSGDTVLIDGAAGGVGSAAVQLAVARGATVVGTASERNHDYLRSLGAIPTTYGPGLAARVRALTDAPITSAVDIVGGGSIAELVEATGDPARVVSIADFNAGEHGVRVNGGSGERFYGALAEAAALAEEGRYVVAVEQTFPLELGSQAQALSQGGHVRGKVVITVP
ncbi:NADPH:quinone reductase [Sanguibacter gelidistatuariae]|uniref:NADPH:quinone reductase n=1 Tax=Sanguibacter gelidistatuariae TaxID=1814289 RepID=A0A1G6GTP0_9MICO|nr:NADP-dependent oxidoreductase [Sanguibacter gelidistatuariae]SDB85291.1 NADPH:quinone reductase [Sanguibacter gelidistatuariae]